ncbi:hypothetical protein OF001_U170047 [Pseudomonas sp. OF001]|uniref:hypothetical protein n=1 Tax=Pseudomonas sp. OF001 TaxID=2772300 RepID=UPI00191B5F43|nr:hypothetical protein [Pseudomonas sp. OF001]CAD5376750.1 hypothetical protein OF001_U170047 [Pseudomonas sp. OF001]
MTRITVVIEDHAEGIHLGQQLAGGRVVSVQQGDHSGAVETLVSLADPKLTPSDGDPAVLREIARAALGTART